MDLEPGARGAPAPAGREPQRLPGPALEAAAWGEEVGPREGRTAGALRPRAAGVGQQHEGAPPQDGEGKRPEEESDYGGQREEVSRKERVSIH